MHMVSTINILGQASSLVPNLDGFRYIKVESSDPFDDNTYYNEIPVRYWDKGTSRVLLDIPDDDYVCILGRLESNPEIGLHVVAEQIRHFSVKKSRKKKNRD